jgi:hypothetical protein
VNAEAGQFMQRRRVDQAGDEGRPGLGQAEVLTLAEVLPVAGLIDGDAGQVG